MEFPYEGTGIEPNDLLVATAGCRLLETTVNNLYIIAPLDAGDILAVKNLPGDLASSSSEAIVIVNPLTTFQ